MDFGLYMYTGEMRKRYKINMRQGLKTTDGRTDSDNYRVGREGERKGGGVKSSKRPQPHPKII